LVLKALTVVVLVTDLLDKPAREAPGNQKHEQPEGGREDFHKP
jgi:hypothetical protein